MAVDFVCIHCGRLTHSPQTAGKTRCMSCGRKVTIPPAVASLPHPVLPHGPPEPLRPPDDPPADPEFRQAEEALARAMPWVISVFLHAGLILIMVFAVMVVVLNKVSGEQMVIPDTVLRETPGGVVCPGKGDPNIEMRQPKPTNDNGWSREEGEISVDTGKTDKRIDLIGRGVGGASGGVLAPPGLTTGGRKGPRSKFLGTEGGNAHHVVFVIDKSGSMAIGGVFDHVRRQMLISISKLREIQDFHVILFADDTPDEYQAKRLVPGNDMYKASVAKWLETVQAHSDEGVTDPVPSLVRAFAVLRNADASKEGKIIYLLTDGVFKDNDLVLRTVISNRSKDVRVHTYLHGFRPPEAVTLMKKIASVTRGDYKYISRDE